MERLFRIGLMLFLILAASKANAIDLGGKSIEFGEYRKSLISIISELNKSYLKLKINAKEKLVYKDERINGQDGMISKYDEFLFSSDDKIEGYNQHWEVIDKQVSIEIYDQLKRNLTKLYSQPFKCADDECSFNGRNEILIIKNSWDENKIVSLIRFPENRLDKSKLEEPKQNNKFIKVSTQPKNDEKPKSSIIIKGFYIGMPIQDVVDLINEKYNEILLTPGMKCFISDNKIIIEANVNPIAALYIYPYFGFDDQQKLSVLSFPSKYVNKLFNVGDLDAKSFVQEFINAYNIPNMDFKSNIDSYSKKIDNWYEYSSPHGYKVSIKDDKTLTLKIIPKESERKFD